MTSRVLLINPFLFIVVVQTDILVTEFYFLIQVLNGKKRFAFGDHGGIVVATDFRETNVLQ